jgi:hypothetical protein
MAVYVRIAVFLSVPVRSRDILPMCSGLKISHNDGSIAFPQNIPACALNYTAVKVKFTLEKTTKAQRGERQNSTVSLTSPVVGFGWSTSRLGRFSPRERDPVSIIQEARWATGPL